jgi:uracil-DNA glycosylase
MSALRDSVLREMGLGPLWRLRSRQIEAVSVAEPTQPAPATEVRQAPRARAPLLQPQTVSPLGPVPRVTTPVDAEGRAARIAQLDWDELEADVAQCSACGLCAERQQVVPGMGDRAARVMFVGEGPGAEEDRQGLPFVGAAGKLLDAMLASIGLSRDSGVYIANTVKCRPPRNRTPEPAEMEACRPYLARQIELVQPSLLVALGRPAAQFLLSDPEVRINASRGKLFRRGDTPVAVTYHPAYLLRNPLDKARAWEDLCAIRQFLGDNTELT